MRYLLRHKRLLAVAILLSFTGVTVTLSPAQAGMITTAQVLNGNAEDPARERVKAFVNRADVRSQLEAYGLDATMAQARVDNLTDEEVAFLAQRLDRLPAGGDFGSTLIVASLVAFLVLLATDIMGYTDVFPFVEK